ncbi:SIR2 family protein [Terrabacter sp. Root181]|uniref:SIR2 family protein n=1 Tax=Terrabacter sp. Root181 TaxID=1736484 RepID=UPI00138ECC6D|nr:SIR2 family protein [Terrabacter sp. Root181]
MIDSAPPELQQAQADGRLIPFVGAGLSMSLGLPSWTDLLRSVSAKISGIPDFDEINASCGGDPLKAAEYLYVATGKEIGPLRQKISNVISRPDVDASTSSAHVELVNLNASRIYTTNYDDLIERTFDALNASYQLIATPRHISQSLATGTQIIKFHGDLQWETSLVFTESSYFERLQFESPLDVKFRSDLLGNSVLFLGYGFSDTNVRVMWHRLMSMMRGVESDERPKSYIVRVDRNPVREALDAAAGIETVVLTDAIADDLNVRMSRFLAELRECGSLGSQRNRFVSPDILDQLKNELQNETQGARSEHLLKRLGSGEVPFSLKPQIEELIELARVSQTSLGDEALSSLSTLYALQFGAQSAAEGTTDG